MHVRPLVLQVQTVERNARVLAGWLSGVPRLRSARGGEGAALPAAGTVAFRRAAAAR